MTTHVFETMGTVVSISFRGDPPSGETLRAVEAEFTQRDERYSLYRADSELSRIASGESPLLDASDDLKATYQLATQWRSLTSGAFTPNRPDGIIDLSGVVKALAMDAAAAQLQKAGTFDWSINVGGDILAAPQATQPWIVGIVDPDDRREFLTSVALIGSRRACATSGSAERGDHIWRTSGTAEFAQATVIADDIVTADVLATAIIAGGATTLDLACSAWSIDAITVDAGGEIRMTPGAVAAMHAAAD